MEAYVKPADTDKSLEQLAKEYEQARDAVARRRASIAHEERCLASDVAELRARRKALYDRIEATRRELDKEVEQEDGS